MNIKNTNVRFNSELFDYELENGTLLHQNEWNGEKYIVSENGAETTYHPVYRFEVENINLDSLEENSPEWNRAFEIVEFE